MSSFLLFFFLSFFFSSLTGELTLTGRVTRIGGVKEKIIAAKRTGMKTVILPKSNQPDWEELDENIKEGINVHFVEHFSQVFEIVFPDFKQTPPNQLQLDNNL